MLYDVSAAPPVSKVNLLKNKKRETFFLLINKIFQRTLDETSTTLDESRHEKKKKDKKLKVEDDDDDNQMQTSSTVDDSTLAEYSVNEQF